MTNEEKIATFDNEYTYINSDEMKLLARVAVAALPEYFFHVAASSTGKYHPSYALDEGGLVRHTKAAVRFAHHLLSLEQNQERFDEHTRDEIIVALMLHDGWKHGPEETAGKYTVFEHPKVAADWILSWPDFQSITDIQTLHDISNLIASHMGQWNTSNRSSVVLEKPLTDAQKFVHECDYLASRKDIIVLFDAEEQKPQKIEDYKIPFGKYKGMTLLEIKDKNAGYLHWMRNKEGGWGEPLDGFLKQLEDEKR